MSARPKVVESAPYEVYTALLGHELRTPVATLQVYLHLLEQDRVLNDDEALRSYLDVIRDQVRHLSGLVTELTTFATVSAGQRPEPGSGDSANPVELIRALAVGHAVEMDLGEDAALATVDMERLRVILEQLFSNAFKYGREGAPIRVEVRIESEPPRLVVRVTNDGEAIPDSIRERVFEPYRQGENPRERRHGGLGLGLTVARSAAEGGGGHVLLEHGSPVTFRVELPIRQDPAARQVRQSQAAAAAAESQAVRAIQDLHTLRTLVQQERQARSRAEEQLAASLLESQLAHEQLAELRAQRT